MLVKGKWLAKEFLQGRILNSLLIAFIICYAALMTDDLSIFLKPIRDNLYTDTPDEVFQKLLLKNVSDFSY